MHAAILLNGWILLTGRVASGRVCPAACAAGLLPNLICNSCACNESNQSQLFYCEALIGSNQLKTYIVHLYICTVYICQKVVNANYANYEDTFNDNNVEEQH